MDEMTKNKEEIRMFDEMKEKEKLDTQTALTQDVNVVVLLRKIGQYVINVVIKNRENTLKSLKKLSGMENQ